MALSSTMSSRVGQAAWLPTARRRERPITPALHGTRLTRRALKVAGSRGSKVVFMVDIPGIVMDLWYIHIAYIFLKKLWAYVFCMHNIRIHVYIYIHRIYLFIYIWAHSVCVFLDCQMGCKPSWHSWWKQPRLIWACLSLWWENVGRMNINYYTGIHTLPSSKLTVQPCQMGVGRWVSTKTWSMFRVYTTWGPQDS